MREIRSPLDGILSPFAARPPDAYAVQGLSPLLVADFTTPYYRKAGSTSTFDSTFTHSRAGNATMMDSDGLVKWAPHNLALNSAAPATQSITVVSGADYTVEITGSGSVALTGAGAGTVTAGNPVEITASTTTLTLTVTGTPSTMWAYRSDLGGMVNNPDTGNSYVPTTSAAVHQARRNHHTYNGTSWVNSGLLLETEARTNLEVNSTNPIVGLSGDTNVTWIASSVTTRDGGTNGYDLLGDATNGLHFRLFNNAGINFSSGSNYALSVDLAPIGDQQYVITGFTPSVAASTSRRACFDLVNGTVAATESGVLAYIEPHNGFYRCTMVVTATSSGTTTDTYFVALQNAASAVPNSYSGSTSDGVTCAFFQVEAAPTPSSYMPTVGATFTRPTESLQIAAADMPWDASNVSLQMQGKITYADEGAEAQQTFARWYDDANNYITIDLDTDSTDTGEVNFEQQDGTGGTGTVTADTYSPGILVPYNIASRNTSTAINGATDGTAGTEDTTPTALPDLSAKDFNLGHDYMGTIGLFRAWNKDIGDAGIEDATS